MRYDFHVHTYRCKHAYGDFEDYIKAAIAQDLDVIGFSDHCPMPDDRWVKVRMYWNELERYVERFLIAKKKYSSYINIYLGFECEYIPKESSAIMQKLQQIYPFDFYSFGGHFTPYNGDWVNTFSGLDSTAKAMAYFDYLGAGAESGFYQFITHPDIYGYGNFSMNSQFWSSVDRFLQICAQEDMVLELNSSGLYKAQLEKHKPIYPRVDFWERVKQHDLPVIINSDAHNPRQLGLEKDQCFRMADKIGLRIVTPEYFGLG